MMKRSIALLLALALTVSMIPVSAVPAYADEILLTAEPTEEVAEPTEEVAEPAEEAAEPTEEAVEPTEEAVEPTEEVVEPTEEVTEPTEAEHPTKADVPTRASVSYSGTWGSNLTWKLYSDGLLELSGTGEMANISSSSAAPWYRYKYLVTSIQVGEGITTVESYAFYEYYNVKTITLASTVTTLEKYAFQRCDSLISVDLGGVTQIGDYAFDGCTALQSVTMNNAVTVGKHAFYECTALQSVTMPKAETLGEWAFYECTALRSVTMPKVVTVEERAFYSCSALKTVTLPETLETLGLYAFYNTGLTEVVLPDSLTTLGGSVFGACDSLTSVTFGNGLTHTGNSTFVGCDNLTQIDFGSGIESIASSSFKDCISLTEVYIPDSVTKINSSAFYGCEAITDVYLGSGLREEYCINSDAFKYCKSIENVWFRGTQEQWYDMSVFGNSYEGTQYLVDANRYFMMGTCGEAVEWDIAFDGTMTIAGAGPMYDYGNGMWPEWNDNVYTKVKRIVVEPGVTTVGDEAFGWMDDLTEVVLPEGLEKVGAYAFANSKALKTVKLPASVKEYGNGAFYGCATIDGIWAAEDSAYFYNDSHGVLFSRDGVLLQAPASLAGTYDIPAGITRIAPYAFADCHELTLVNYPDSVTSIGFSAFYRCIALTKLNVPATVTQIEHDAFAWCSNLTVLDIPKGITRIEDAVFADCMGLTEVVIPDNITFIGNSAFSNCFESLKSITIPDSVTYIDDYAFSWLWALESITIPDSVTYLGYGAFDTCEALKTVNLGAGLDTIHGGMFYGCLALEEVYIPKSIGTIEASAFADCESLHTVWYNGEEADWNIIEIEETFNEPLLNAQVQLLKDRGSCGTNVSWRLMQDGSLIISGTGAMDDYSDTSAPWAAYAGEIEYLHLADGVTSVGANAFAGLTKLTAVEIPASVTQIGDGAFSGCSALPAIGFPEAVTYIGAGAFSGCAKLEELYLPSQLTAIGENAFAGCAKLTAVEIPASVTQIGDSAFSGCSALASITVAAGNAAYCTDDAGVLFNMDKTRLILVPVTLSGSYSVPMSVTQIDANAFNTKALTDITIPAGVTTIGADAFKLCYKLRTVRYYGSPTAWEQIEIAAGNDRLQQATFSYTEAAGSCGENLIWEIESGGLLIISGTGPMDDYNASPAPWADFAASIRTLQISEGITSIGSGAFIGFTALTQVQIPDSVTSVGVEAFVGCSNLVTLSLGSGVTRVGEDAFIGCTGLKTVSVGSGLTVDEYTFANCTALEAVEIDPMNPYCQSVDGLVYSADGTVLTFVPRGRSGSVVLPAGVEVIGSNAFENSGVSSVILPEGVTAIGQSAFLNSSLKEVELPNTLNEIGAYAFAGTRLQSVKLPGSITFIGSNAFAGCDELTSVTLPAGLETVSAELFAHCTALKTVTVPASVTEISSNAFSGCAALTTVFWQGSAEEFALLTIEEGNEALQNAMIVVDQTVSVLAAPNPSTGKPKLEWDAVEGVTKYEVHRATSIDGKYKKLKTVSATTYTDTSASTGSEYYYKIKALYGKNAVEIGIAISRCVCAQPKVKVSVSSSTGLPTLSWSKISGASKYTILRATAPNGEYTELAVQKSTKYTDKTASADTIYYYRVLVVPSKTNAECVSPAPVRVVTTMAKPSIKAKANADGKPQITCGEISGAIEYKLYRSTSKKGTYTQILTSDKPLLVDETAAIGKTYYYKVSAAGKHSESAISSYASVKCLSVSPEITVVRSDVTGKAYITWEAVSGAKKYEIYRATKETGSYKKIATTSSLVYEDTKASVGKTYYYKVYTVPSSSGAKSIASNIGSVYAICAQPVLKVSYSSSGQHTISWSKVSGASKYEIWRADSADGEFVLLATQKGTSYTDKATQPDTCYYYKVNVLASKAVNNSIDATPKLIARAIARPSISVGNDENGKPVITWNAIAGAVRYKVYRATSSKGTYTLVGNVIGTSYTNTRAEVGKRYYYKVVAFGENSESSMSSYDDTYGKLPVPVMTGGEQDLATGKPVISWSAVDGAKKYDVYRATKENGTYKKIKSGTTSLTYTDSDAKNKTTYYYKVVAVASNTKANSNKSDWYSVTSGNISSSDAKMRALLIKMERWTKYLDINADILRTEAELYWIDYHDDGEVLRMIKNVGDCREYISNVKSACGSNVHLYPLKLECQYADAPIWAGNDTSYVIKVESFARDIDKIISMYNIIRNSYGLPAI